MGEFLKTKITILVQKNKGLKTLLKSIINGEYDEETEDFKM